MAIPEHQVRVIKELEEIETLHKDLTAVLEKLKDRAHKLEVFMETKNGVFANLEPAEQVRLDRQHFAILMTYNSLHQLLNKHDSLPGYIKVLSERIEAF